MAILKDLIVQGAARIIGDSYFATVKSGTWRGDTISIDKGGTGSTTLASTALANGDSLIFYDSSENTILKRTSVTFDGSTITKALTQKGTFESFLNASSTLDATKLSGTIPAACYTNSRDSGYGGIGVYLNSSAGTANTTCAASTYNETLKIIQGDCMTITAANSSTAGSDTLTIGVSSTYKAIMDYYARTGYYSSTISISPTTYDKGASSVSITVTMTPKKEGATYTTTSSDSAKYGVDTTTLGTTMTRNTNNFTATYTFTPNSSSVNKTIRGQINIGGVDLIVQPATLTCQQKVYYGKSVKTTGLTATDLADTTNFKTVMASSKGSTVTNIPAGNGTTEYWWFATPFTFTQMQNTTTYETSGCVNTGETLSMNNSTYYLWRTTSIAATVTQNWKIGL